ncbi:hypothetical protein KC343_g1624 [Hortaea werneckii]|nr:hypothetical protein KC365_g14621 [Hortaea werneckii]KAI7262379.1 hypothetical protein KC352_g9763 [Hortaea werneckii]KAI7568412.1 hypothetical protein KC317_g4215 [Hortaea werneckii]KAI7635770.1 hypothetical protein KC343_g1624 [Hortaea werneckii]KAI7681700.1 hypothetical protein KC319_g1423 [Hortaea werneckii]
MNCPSRIDPVISDSQNQNPDAFASEVTTGSDFGQIANARLHYEYRLADVDPSGIEPAKSQRSLPMKEHVCKGLTNGAEWAAGGEYDARSTSPARDTHIPSPEGRRDLAGATVPSRRPKWQQPYFKTASVLRRYAKFVGPGFMISVAYIDPGNYATDVAAGASYRFQLLFMILLSNIFAIFLQFLCIKLGSVTGLNLAEMSKAHFPSWLNYLLYFFAESAIIATDIAEVIGTAIALNLLLNVPLVAGLYQACGILGATVMPHSLYLGSGIVQARLKEHDDENRVPALATAEDGSEPEEKYRPSLSAIRSCLSYSIIENSISLFTFALFVNSAILIVAGASLYTVTGADNADLFGIHELLSSTMAPIAGTIFALALLLSGTSAGIVCTIAGQMAKTGYLLR